MSGLSAASLTLRRAPLVLGLCLLALLFAVEAKTAWYGPVVGLESPVSAAKALPANSPEVVEQGVPVPDPTHPQIAFATIATKIIVGSLKALVPANGEAFRNRAPVFSAAYFSPLIFFRPPPAL